MTREGFAGRKMPRVTHDLSYFFALHFSAIAFCLSVAEVRSEELPTPRLPRDKLLLYRGPNNEQLPVKTPADWLKRRQNSRLDGLISDDQKVAAAARGIG